jgi:hypothetical protein
MLHGLTPARAIKSCSTAVKHVVNDSPAISAKHSTKGHINGSPETKNENPKGVSSVLNHEIEFE